MPQDLPTRSFAWSNMFVTPEEDPRADGGFPGERDTLLGFLRGYRLTPEYARHMGHADLLRERIDGRVGI